jgi:hypothetical protein
VWKVHDERDNADEARARATPAVEVKESEPIEPTQAERRRQARLELLNKAARLQET